MADIQVSQTDAAYEVFLRVPIVQASLHMLGDREKLVVGLLKVAFMNGAKYATDRCEREHRHG